MPIAHEFEYVKPASLEQAVAVLAEVWDRLEEEIPPVLTLEQQTLFALGYYKQKAKPYGKKATEENGSEVTDE